MAQRTAASPLVPLALFRDQLLRASLGMNVLIAAVMMATLVVGPFYLARGLGLEPALVGLVMSVGPVTAAIGGIPAGRSVDRLGATRVILAGLASMVIGCLALCIRPEAWGVAGYVAPIVLVTAGYAAFQAANTTSVMTGVSPEQRGVVSGMLALSRNLGLVTGASALGAVFSFASHAHQPAVVGAAAAAFGMRTTFGVATAMIVLALVTALWSRSR
jgi:MFS family permease